MSETVTTIHKCRFLGHVIVNVSTVHVALPAVNARSQKNEIICGKLMILSLVDS